MTAPTRFALARVLRFAGSLSRAALWLLGSVALIVTMIVYCELSGIVSGEAAPGLKVSAPWALQVSFGWIVVGAVLGAFGERIASSRMAGEHPRTLVAMSIVCSTIITLSSEALLTHVIEGSPLAKLLYQRAPMDLAVSALLILLYAGQRVWRRRATVEAGAEIPQESPDSDEQLSVPSVAPTESRSDGLIEVMTGTGRTSIELDEIECLHAEGNYINVMHASGRTYLLRQTLTALERSLDSERFVRVHRSIIVNRRMIRESRCGNVLVLLSGRTVRMSRALRKRLQ